MKKTALSEKHESMGAKMVAFAGYHMPIQFEGVIAEHLCVRNKLGVFDVSHMGEFWVEGPNAFALVQRITSNDLALLTDGKVQYTCFPNERNGIVDDLLVYRFNQEKYLLVVNAANTEKDWQWVVRHNHGIDAIIRNASDEISQLAVQGPLAMKAMQQLTGEAIEDMPFYTFKETDFAGAGRVILSTTGYTGSGGCEIYMDNAQALAVYEAVLEAGASLGIKPIGLAARDTLRLEMGFCLYGNDIDETTSPLEAGLGWITKFTEGNDFVNRDALFALKQQGLERKLVGLEVNGRGIPRKGYEILDSQEQPIGYITSGTQSPSLGKPIGLGYVQQAFAAPGTEVLVRIRNQALQATVVRPPFYKQA